MGLDSLTLGVAGIATVGLITSVQVITGWVRELLSLDGNQVRIAATVIAGYIVLCFGLTQSTWTLYGTDVASGAAWAGIGLYLVALIASTASAYYERFNSE